MRFYLAAGFLLLVSASGCAALGRLDSYSACGDGCVDATVDARVRTPLPDGDPEDAGTDDAQDMEADVGNDANASPEAAAADASPDGSPGEPGDAGSDCGPVDTVESCGACGLSCDTTHGVDAGCSGGACVYQQCIAGWSDCNQTPPNRNGCECQTPSCCSGGTCQTAHSNGVAQTFYDCMPQGTYTEAQAMEACVAFTGGSTLCKDAPTGVCGSSRAVCSNGASACWCWTYAGSAVGTVAKQSGLCPSGCPSANDTMWN